jgi:hypothetical protein
MKKMSRWDKPVAFLALGLISVGSIKANATILSSISTGNKMLASVSTPSQKEDNAKLAQRRVGACRAAARSTFIYQDRSTAYRIRSLQPNEKVTLAEERGRAGWVAISSPISGFVETKDLKLCSEGSVRPVSPSSNLCRQVTYKGLEGVAIRERPDINSRQLDAVFLSDRVTLVNPPQFILDDQGREWVRLSAPSAGWMSNGFPATGDINLEACL